MISLPNPSFGLLQTEVDLFLFYKIIIIDIDTIFRLDYRVIVM